MKRTAKKINNIEENILKVSEKLNKYIQGNGSSAALKKKSQKMANSIQANHFKILEEEN